MPCRLHIEWTARTVRLVSRPLVLGFLLAAPVAAQDSSDDAQRTTVEEEILVSASLTEVPRHRTGNTVTVIDREEIERRNKDTVLELLRTVPGLEVAQTGGPGKTTSVFLRGGNSSHTLVTVDGVRLNDNSTGGFDFSDLTADNLERIEVIRGPQGLLHGSEAVAGAINIITRRGEGPAQGWVRGAAGNDGYSRFAAGVSGGSERLDYSFSASRLATDAVSAASEENGNTEVDPWENLTVSGRLGGRFLDDGRAELTLRYTDGDTDVDGFTFGVGPTDDLNAVQKRTTLTTSLSLDKPITDRWTQSLVVTHGSDELSGEDPDDFFSNFDLSGETSSISTQADLQLAESDTLSIGYKVERRTAENIGSFDESVTIRSFYAENLWSWNERVDLSLGLRNDDHTVFGNETTYRAALSALLADPLRLHASFGTGFKAPTFNDLYFPGFGNLDLRPETSKGFDLGFELTLLDERLVLDLTYFDSELEDLILFTFPAGFVNIAEATSEGFELVLDWAIDDRTRLQASHTFTETEDLASGLPLARRPENRSTLGLSFEPVDKLRASATLVAVSDRIDSDGSEMDDYERVDLSADYQIDERFRPFVRIENLFDSDYSEIPGYTALGFSFAAGLHVTF